MVIKSVDVKHLGDAGFTADITVKEDKKPGKMKIKIFNSAKYEVICRGLKPESSA